MAEIQYKTDLKRHFLIEQEQHVPVGKLLLQYILHIWMFVDNPVHIWQ
jgi:hypothetical protein